MWQSRRGYVMIQIVGVYPERLVNRALERHIPLANIRRVSRRCMTMELAVNNLLELRPVFRACRCRMHIVKRYGTPFVLARFARRKTLLIGLALGFSLLLYGSLCIWRIEVTGQSNVPEAVVLRAAEAYGVAAGMPRSRVKPLELGAAIRNYDKRIAWAGATVRGITLYLKIMEAQSIPSREDVSAPVDIIAGRDAVITEITATYGKAVVKAGDAVKAGDVLITGDITREGAAAQLLVHAAGEVQGLWTHTAYATVAGEESAQELASEALFQAEIKALYAVPQAARIVQKESLLRILPDGAVQGVVTVTAQEDIGRESPVTPRVQLQNEE